VVLLRQDVAIHLKHTVRFLGTTSTYTIAMIFAEKMNPFGFKNLSIFATDYDSANNFGDVVTAAVYPAEELQRTPDELLGKYF